jgi:hypothetical protein
MKYLLWVLILVAMLTTACDRQGPLNVSRFDPNDEVIIGLDDSTELNHHIVTPYFPANWCPASVNGLINPWVIYTKNGVRTKEKNIFDLINPKYPNYYPVHWWVNKNGGDDIFFVKYGNYDCNCEIPNVAAICSTSKFAVYYHVTPKKGEAEWVLAFHIVNGKVYPIDPNIIRPITARINIPFSVILNQPTQFSLDQLDYTKEVGIFKITWTFPDGYERIGDNVVHSPLQYGMVKVTIEDNLGHKAVFTRDLQATNSIFSTFNELE